MQSAVKERIGPLAVDVGGMTLYNVGIENKALLLFYDSQFLTIENTNCLIIINKNELYTYIYYGWRRE